MGQNTVSSKNYAETGPPIEQNPPARILPHSYCVLLIVRGVKRDGPSRNLVEFLGQLRSLMPVSKADVVADC